MRYSVVIPAYNEQEVLPESHKRLRATMDALGEPYELIFVNDGSRDETPRILARLAQEDPHVKVINFSRNFGHQAAVSAGLDRAAGQAIVIIDADLQDPPSLLKTMYDAIVNEGYEQVATRRVTRKGEPPLRSFCARMFYKLINSASDFEMTDGARDYRLMTRKVVDAILSLPEKSRYSKGIFSFVGFRTKWIPYENVERAAGKTKWSFRKLFRYATDGLISFSDLFLKFSRFLCALFFIFFFALAISSVILKSSALAVLGVGFLVGGTVLVSQIVNGKYLEQTFREVKQRPLYIISETERDGEKE